MSNTGNRSKFSEAVDLAERVHRGQKRNGGAPYIVHPLTVAAHVAARLPDNRDAQIVAVLHDALEDCDPKDLDRLEQEITTLFGDAVLSAVRHLTRRGEDDRKYEYLRIEGAASWVSTVKLCDMWDNRTIAGLANNERAQRWISRKIALMPALIRGDRRLWLDMWAWLLLASNSPELNEAAQYVAASKEVPF